jgi:hypothetical protein
VNAQVHPCLGRSVRRSAVEGGLPACWLDQVHVG